VRFARIAAMSEYTKLNLVDDVEDMAPKFGFSPNLESRFARQALAMQEGGLSHFRMRPGVRSPFGHRHGEQEEVYVLLAGSARIKLDDEIVDLRPLDAVRVPGPVARAIEAGPDGCELLAFGAPNTNNADAEMLAGWWSD
jgi:mannose-6-phosphate isomerase-like protein (cupin superfamily)